MCEEMKQCIHSERLIPQIAVGCWLAKIIPAPLVLCVCAVGFFRSFSRLSAKGEAYILINLTFPVPRVSLSRRDFRAKPKRGSGFY